ncbi:MAG TPA: hypothetical protein VGO47_02675, partial [Chlamydiales bacterium]|nr:hypothetical protein [Chlamydiales bacterium]
LRLIVITSNIFMSSTSNSTYKSTHPFHDFLKNNLERVGHTTSYDIYLRDRNDSLRQWVQARIKAHCPDKSEKEYVCWAINEYGTLETAKENLVSDWLVSEISPAILFDPKKEPLGLIGVCSVFASDGKTLTYHILG